MHADWTNDRCTTTALSGTALEVSSLRAGLVIGVLDWHAAITVHDRPESHVFRRQRAELVRDLLSAVWSRAQGKQGRSAWGMHSAPRLLLWPCAVW